MSKINELMAEIENEWLILFQSTTISLALVYRVQQIYHDEIPTVKFIRQG